MEKFLRLKLRRGQFLGVTASRSRTMAAIRAKHTKTTERALRMALIRAGIRGWQLHPADLPGRPDIYFPKQRVAIFVDGCFWHGCAKCGHIPKARRIFWYAKIIRNRQRDKVNSRKLRQQKLKVIRIWEHSLANNYSADRALAKIVTAIATQERSVRAPIDSFHSLQ